MFHPEKNFKYSQADGLYVCVARSIPDLDRAYKLLSHVSRYRVVLVALLLLGVIVIALTLITMQERAITMFVTVAIIVKEDQMVAAVVVGDRIIIIIHQHHPTPTMSPKLPIRNYDRAKCQHTWYVSLRVLLSDNHSQLLLVDRS